MKRERGSIDYVFLGITGCIILAGLLMIASAGGPLGFDRFGDSYYFIKHQILFGLVPGIAMLIVFSRIPYQWWRKHAWPLLWLSIALLLLVFIPGVASDFGTSRSWINVAGAFSIQPSEIVKLTFLFYLAAWLEKRGRKQMRDVHAGLVPFLLTLGVVALLMILQPDIGTLSIIVIMSLTVYFVAGAPIEHLSAIGFLGAMLFALLVKIAPYRAARLTAFMNPEADPLGIGYHINQALIAVGSGGILGLGFGHSVQKFQYLPEVVNDSIFAILAEELGFIFAALFILLYIVFFIRGLQIAGASKNVYGKYVVIGVITWITAQAFINIGSMLGLLPLTGVPLPLVSYGGTALAITMGAIGVILNISRETQLKSLI